MSDLAIHAEGLGKRYRIGPRAAYGSLRESIMGALAAPFRGRGRAEAGGRPTVWALKDVGFEVRPGEVVGVIGRNGAGKSTLLKVLSRITEPTEGRATIRGRVGSLLEVGTGFHPELSGRENVFLNGAVLGMRRAEIAARFDEIVGFAETERFLDTPVKHYSSGMYMRLAFAVAAHLDPEVLLVDEVLAVGDVEFQRKCLGKMRDVARTSGRTVLFVSHNMNAVEQLCGRVILFEAGRLACDSPDPRAVIKRYLFGGGDGPRADEWVNPGGLYDNRWFVPTRFRLCDAEGRPLQTPVSNSAPMFVEVEGTVGEVDPALTVGYAVFAEDGSLLYWSYQTDTRPEAWPELRPGRCVLRGPIPSRFLNEGQYRVELIASLHFRQWLLEPGVSAPSVHLHVQGGLSDSPYWMARRPGLLAPELAWTRVD